MTFTNQFAKKLLDHCFGATTYTPPATVVLCLLKSLPADGATVADLVKADYTGYADVTLSNNGTTWLAGVLADRTKSLNIRVEFPEATAGDCTVVAAAIVDPTNNIIMAKGALQTNREYVALDLPRLEPSDIIISL